MPITQDRMIRLIQYCDHYSMVLKDLREFSSAYHPDSCPSIREATRMVREAIGSQDRQHPANMALDQILKELENLILLVHQESRLPTSMLEKIAVERDHFRKSQVYNKMLKETMRRKNGKGREYYETNELELNHEPERVPMD